MLGPHEEPKKPDWRAIAALIWALWFGVAYSDRMVRAKAPRVSSAISRLWHKGWNFVALQ